MSTVYDCLGPEGYGCYEIDWSTNPPYLTRVSRAPDLLLVPGFVDIHIHGAFGIDFMSASTADMEALAKKLENIGYEALLPTTVSAGPEEVLKAVSQLPEHLAVPGFHLEGPFISPARPGAQPKAAIAEADWRGGAWDAVLDHPKLRVATIAPEFPGALELISRLSQRGVVVSMGHTDATYDEARFGFEFGATHMTHFYNAMRPLHHREAGVIGYGLMNDSLRCELIYDRFHVGRDAAALLLRSKPQDGVIAVSDCSMAAGLPNGSKFQMWGIEAEYALGKVTLAGTDTLAGSAATLLDVFRNLHEDFGSEVAIRCCCLNPRLALGITESPRVYVELNRKLEIERIRTAR